MALSDMSPSRAMSLDFALLPGDRQNASGVDSLPIVDNMLLPESVAFSAADFSNAARCCARRVIWARATKFARMIRP